MLRLAFKLLATLVVVLLICTVAALYYLRNHGITVELTQVQLQAQIERHFPQTHQLPRGVSVELKNPLILLENDTNRLRYRLGATARLAPLPTAFDGEIEVSGLLRYQPLTHEFFLDDGAIESLDFRGLPPQFRPRLAEVADQLGSRYLFDRPLYTLDGPLFPDDGWLAYLPPVALQSVTIDAGKIKVHALLDI